MALRLLTSTLKNTKARTTLLSTADNEGLYNCVSNRETSPHSFLIMFTKEDTDFIDFLFGKLTSLTDVEMIDLHDDDSCCDHLEFEQLTLF